MKLGAFSISLAVKDIEKSKNFYQQLGFQVFAGEQQQNWLIMKCDQHCIGLFQGMFDSNIMTFNPGWDQAGNPLDSFTDVRELLSHCKSANLNVTSKAISGDKGPSNFTLQDPDGNSILIDQHV